VGSSALPDATVVRWTALLDELEQELSDAAGDDPRPVWRPPADLGPLPDELRARAEALARAQADAIAVVAAAKRSAARHLTALRTVPQHRRTTGPLYLDASG
jgi:hypothetical protein